MPCLFQIDAYIELHAREDRQAGQLKLYTPHLSMQLLWK